MLPCLYLVRLQGWLWSKIHSDQAVHLAVVMMAMADKGDDSPPEHPWPYFKSMFEVFEMNDDSCGLKCLYKLHHGWQKFAVQPEKVCWGVLNL